MVATVFFDWAMSFGVGLLFGVAGGSALRETPSRLSSRAFRLGIMFETFAVLPIALAVYVLEPDWMWMFWVDSARLPIALEVFAFAMYFVSFLAGFLLAPELERLRAGLAWVAAVVGGATLLAAAAFTWERLRSLGSILEFETGAAGTFSGTPLWITVGGLAVATVALAGALVSLTRGSRTSA